MLYIVDVDKQEDYTDGNSVTWWGHKYRGSPDVLKLYQKLEGKEKQGIKVVKAIKEGVWIKLVVECQEDISGFYLNTGLKGILTEDNHVESIEYDSIHIVELPLSDNYAVPGAEPFKIYNGVFNNER